MKLTLSCENQTFSSSFLTDSFSKETIFYNNLQQADNSCSCTIPYNMEIQNFINAYADKNIKAEIKDDDTYVFTGYLRKNFTFSKKQRNQPIKIEIVSPSFLLNKDLPEDVVLEKTTLGTIVDKINKTIGIVSNAAITIKDSINFFSANKGENIKTIYSSLFLEYGYCYDFDESGTFLVYPIFDIPEDFNDPVYDNYKFDGSNCLNEIKVSKKEQEFNNVKIKWNKLENKNGIIFADTTNGNNTTLTCNIELPPKTYLGNTGAESYYINYDNEQGEVNFVLSAKLILESTNNAGLKYSFKNLGKKGELSIYNNTSAPITITKINVTGNFYCVTGINETAVTLGDKTKTYESKYVIDSVTAKKLAENYSNYVKYADYTITLKSKTDYVLGNFVKIIEDGLGKINGRIIKKKSNLKNNTYEYTIEAVSEYEKAIANTKENQNSRTLVNKGEDGKSVVAINSYYLATSKSSGITADEVTLKNPPTLTPENKYMWMVQESVLNDLSKLPKTEPVIIGVYGDTGKQGLQGIQGETGADGKNGTNYWVKQEWINLSDSKYNQNTWYPVTTGLDTVNRIKVSVHLNSGTKPSWSTHNGGFSVDFDITDERSGWGTTYALATRTIDTCDWVNDTKQSPVSYTQLTYGSVGVLYLRGGGSYYVSTDFNSNWTIHKDGYVWKGSGHTQEAPVVSSRPIPKGTLIDRGGTYRGGATSAPSSPVYQDYYLNTNEGKIYYYSSNQWQPDNDYTSWRYTLAMPDMVKLAGKINNPSVTSAVNLWCKNLMAQKAIIDELATKKIRLTSNGAIVGGERYNEDGTLNLSKKNKSGVYLSSDGTFKGTLEGDNNNVIIGKEAGSRLNYQSSSNGQQNVIVGDNAGVMMTSGYLNTCIGDNSGTDVTSGFENVCIGASTGVTENDYKNIVIGTGNQTKGNNNINLDGNVENVNSGIVIGSSKITNGSNLIAIGSNINVSGNNKVMIGNQLRDTKPLVNISDVFKHDGAHPYVKGLFSISGSVLTITTM